MDPRKGASCHSCPPVASKTPLIGFFQVHTVDYTLLDGQRYILIFSMEGLSTTYTEEVGLWSTLDRGSLLHAFEVAVASKLPENDVGRGKPSKHLYAHGRTMTAKSQRDLPVSINMMSSESLRKSAASESFSCVVYSHLDATSLLPYSRF